MIFSWPQAVTRHTAQTSLGPRTFLESRDKGERVVALDEAHKVRALAAIPFKSDLEALLPLRSGSQRPCGACDGSPERGAERHLIFLYLVIFSLKARTNHDSQVCPPVPRTTFHVWQEGD